MERQRSTPKTGDLDVLFTWARDMSMCYWTAVAMFWHLSINKNMEVDHQSSKQITSMPKGAILHEVVVVQPTRPRTMPLASHNDHKNETLVCLLVFYFYAWLTYFYSYETSLSQPFGSPELCFQSYPSEKVWTGLWTTPTYKSHGLPHTFFFSVSQRKKLFGNTWVAWPLSVTYYACQHKSLNAKLTDLLNISW